MYAPAVHDEITTLVGYVDQQLDAIRAAPYGLTEEQARQRPCRSALSVGGIVKHVTYGMREALRVLMATDVPAAPDPSQFGQYLASFALADDEFIVDMLAAFDQVRERYLAVLAEVNPDADTLAPPAPWHGVSEALPTKARYYLWHQVEEFARHAGHVDIIREQIDGASVPTLVLTRGGVPANEYFQLFVPESGTIDF
jgi:hypothetical protein